MLATQLDTLMSGVITDGLARILWTAYLSGKENVILKVS